MSTDSSLNRKLCVAPMMSWTDRHCRVLHRLLAPDALLYSEMAVTGALIHGDSARILNHSVMDSPCAFQLGGCDPQQLSVCARMVEDAGYQEINFNVGCPSDRVQSGRIGACLMAEPQLVAECVHHMQQSVNIPVTVKTRVGIDAHDSYEFFKEFITTVASGGCRIFIVHARIAMLQGLSPKDNRQIPTLKHQYVYQLKEDCPDLTLILNGGIRGLDQIDHPLSVLDGVMLGREAYHNPYVLAQLQQKIFTPNHPLPDRLQILERYLEHLSAELAAGHRLQHGAKHLLGLFQGIPGARKFRRHMSEHMFDPQAGIDIIHEAAGLVDNNQLGS